MPKTMGSADAAGPQGAVPFVMPHGLPSSSFPASLNQEGQNVEAPLRTNVPEAGDRLLAPALGHSHTILKSRLF